MSYLVVTPARNEEDMLLGLAKDMLSQFIKPVLWVIVDDVSNDKTWDIITALEKEYNWIRGFKISSIQNIEYANIRYNKVVKKGLDYAMELCRKCSLNFEYLAIVDSDVRLENRYFEKIINILQSDVDVGIASGFVYEKGMSAKELERSNTSPRGCALVFRKACYESIGGFQGHTNSLIKAKNRKWRTKVVLSAKAIHRRRSGSGKNYYLTAGKTAYFYNYHPVNAFLTGIYLLITDSPIKGLEYLAGFFECLILKKDRIKDEEIKEYYWNRFDALVHRIIGCLSTKTKNFARKVMTTLKTLKRGPKIFAINKTVG